VLFRSHKITVQSRYNHANGVGTFTPQITGKCIETVTHLLCLFLDQFLRILVNRWMIFQRSTYRSGREVQGFCNVVYSNFPKHSCIQCAKTNKPKEKFTVLYHEKIFMQSVAKAI